MNTQQQERNIPSGSNAQMRDGPDRIPMPHMWWSYPREHHKHHVLCQVSFIYFDFEYMRGPFYNLISNVGHLSGTGVPDLVSTSIF